MSGQSISRFPGKEKVEKMLDPYSVLGITRGALDEEIKKEIGRASCRERV